MAGSPTAESVYALIFGPSSRAALASRRLLLRLSFILRRPMTINSRTRPANFAALPDEKFEALDERHAEAAVATSKRLSVTEPDETHGDERHRAIENLLANIRDFRHAPTGEDVLQVRQHFVPHRIPYLGGGFAA